MDPVNVALGIFVCISGGAMAGMWLQTILPKHHLSADTRELVKLGVGLVGTMAALVLGLMVASTKASYDTHRAELTQIAANTILVDRVLAHYGPEAADARAALGEAVKRSLHAGAGAAPGGALQEATFDRVQELTPKDDRQKTLQSQAISLLMNIGQTRWLLFAQSGSAISGPFMVIVVLWLTVLAMSFGMFAPRHGTAVVSLLVSASAVAGALYLILELDQPFSGKMRISDAPLRGALEIIGH
jgi:hypothetical protein